MIARATLVLLCAVMCGACTGNAEPAQGLVSTVRVPGGGVQPEIAAGRDGVLHMVYLAGEPRTADVFYVRSSDDGATFSTPVRVNSVRGSAIALGIVRGAQVAVGPDSVVHVVWNGTSPNDPQAGPPLFYARSNAAGTAFEAQRNLLTHSRFLDGGGSVAVDADGKVSVVWHAQPADGARDEANRRVWLTQSIDGGATFTREAPVWSEPTGVCECCGVRLLAAADRLHLLYRTATRLTSRDIVALTSSDRGRTFEGAPIARWEIGMCPMTTMAIATDGSHVWGAWETAGQVWLGDLANRSTSPRAAAGASGDRKHPRLAINARGEVLTVWTEQRVRGENRAVSWQLFDARDARVETSAQLADLPPRSFATVFAHRNSTFVVVY